MDPFDGADENRTVGGCLPVDADAGTTPSVLAALTVDARGSSEGRGFGARTWPSCVTKSSVINALDLRLCRRTIAHRSSWRARARTVPR